MRISLDTCLNGKMVPFTVLKRIARLLLLKYVLDALTQEKDAVELHLHSDPRPQHTSQIHFDLKQKYHSNPSIIKVKQNRP